METLLPSKASFNKTLPYGTNAVVFTAMVSPDQPGTWDAAILTPSQRGRGSLMQHGSNTIEFSPFPDDVSVGDTVRIRVTFAPTGGTPKEKTLDVLVTK